MQLTELGLSPPFAREAPPESGFKAARREIFLGGVTFGNPEHFADAVVYVPANGGPPRRVAAALQQNEIAKDGTEWDHRQEETLWIEVARVDAALGDVACPRGGIAHPAAGDQIQLPHDPRGATWLYDEQQRHITDFSWQLLFRRHWVRGRGAKSK